MPVTQQVAEHWIAAGALGIEAGAVNGALAALGTPQGRMMQPARISLARAHDSAFHTLTSLLSLATAPADSGS